MRQNPASSQMVEQGSRIEEGSRIEDRGSSEKGKRAEDRGSSEEGREKKEREEGREKKERREKKGEGKRHRLAKSQLESSLLGPSWVNAQNPAPNPQKWDIPLLFQKLRAGLQHHEPAMMFLLRDQGFHSPFEILVGTLISTRTRDQMTQKVCLRLFQVARTPQQLLQLSEAELVELLKGAGFPEVKARDLREIAQRIVEDHNGLVPDTLVGLMAFRGVGPKVAALTLAIGFNRPAICVDIHVHRIVNRWGYVKAKTPEKTQIALEACLPKPYWIEINEQLVALGKAFCSPKRPKCSLCPVNEFCQRVGVTESR